MKNKMYIKLSLIFISINSPLIKAHSECVDSGEPYWEEVGSTIDHTMKRSGSRTDPSIPCPPEEVYLIDWEYLDDYLKAWEIQYQDRESLCPNTDCPRVNVGSRDREYYKEREGSRIENEVGCTELLIA